MIYPRCIAIKAITFYQDRLGTAIVKRTQNKAPPFLSAQDEIFGLLGPNGAGKTTLIRCITGAEQTRMDEGDVTVQGHSCKTDLGNARKYMGVCPQFDAQLDDLTAREHLRLFARIRGVPPERIEDAISHYIAALDLSEKADAKVSPATR
jgi:ABC-type multidrug transport system ATPase subunit